MSAICVLRRRLSHERNSPYSHRFRPSSIRCLQILIYELSCFFAAEVVILQDSATKKNGGSVAQIVSLKTVCTAPAF